jgi:ABC-2 type transport system permease protein
MINGIDKRCTTMGNVLIIAKKEFMNLVTSRLILIVLAWYIFIFLIAFYNDIYPFDGYPSWISHFNNLAQGIFIDFVYMSTYSGSIIGIVLGFISISSEVDGKALNTLLVKPLYRDTIINGKLLGVIIFVLCLFAFNMLLYLGAMSIYALVVRNAFNPLFSVYIPTFIGYLPLALILSLLCILFTYSITILMCLVFKNQSLSLFLSLLIWLILFRLVENVSFSGNIGLFANSNSISELVSDFSPYYMVSAISGIMINQGISGVINKCGLNIFMLFAYCFIAIILAYIAFLRRDVA